MRKIHLLLFLALFPFILFSQNLTVSGTVQDGEGKPLSYVNVLLFEIDGSTAIKGVVTEENGSFSMTLPEEKSYNLQCSFVGYKTVLQKVSPPYKPLIIQLKEDTEALEETVVIARKPIIRREAGKLIFDVENSSMSTGNTYQLLSKTPGVIVIGESFTIKKDPAVVYINNKRVYLSSSELVTLLKNMDASNIKSIEVISNPSAKYDANVKSILNIVTSKAVSIGYKGSVNTTYEQAIFPKYNFSTSHFYKNNWLNIYGSYGYSPRIEFKRDDNFVRYFNADNTTKSIYESEFNKTTHSYANQGNVIADIIINDKNSLSFYSNILVSPNTDLDSNIYGEILNGQEVVDSTFNTHSFIKKNTDNLAFNLEHQFIVSKETNITTSVDYVYYENNQTQDLNSVYKYANGDLLRDFRFITDAFQNTNILTASTNLETKALNGKLEGGVKYSGIENKAKYDFFDIVANQEIPNTDFSDNFNYNEQVFAGFINYSRSIKKWSVNAGLRGEHTYIKTYSVSLSQTNKQRYFNLFPTLTLLYNQNKDNSYQLSYKRSIIRPRYQALNPFTYFVTDNILSKGNPELIPTIKNKILLGYYLKNKWEFETYVIFTNNPLHQLIFQNNENNTIQTLQANIVKDLNFSIDASHYSYVLPWWHLYVYTSGYYLENEFYSFDNHQETYVNNTLGFYSYIGNTLTLSKDKTLSGSVTFEYISAFLSGNSIFKNQQNLSFSIRKLFWDRKAMISMGVDDVFNTRNIPVTTRYANQDNSYFAQIESRLFRLGFKYNFGNARLRDNKRTKKTEEKERL